MADSELSAKFLHRRSFSEVVSLGHQRIKRYFNPYQEFTRKEIKAYEKTFRRFDIGGDNFIDFEELKRMMEVLGVPQTHIALKKMIAEIDEDKDNKISFREFLLIYSKARADELGLNSGLSQLVLCTEIDVGKVGVRGAKKFFEAKIEEQSRKMEFEEEFMAEQEEIRRANEERIQRKAAFKQKASFFQQTS